MRVKPPPDLSLHFMAGMFKREVERPYKQLRSLTALWSELLPPALLEHTRLEGLSHGVLRVAVASSSHLYELDRLLRQGLQRQLIQQHKGPAVRKVKLRVAPWDQPEINQANAQPQQ
jgi:hypothetical protein